MAFTASAARARSVSVSAAAVAQPDSASARSRCVPIQPRPTKPMRGRGFAGSRSVAEAAMRLLAIDQRFQEPGGPTCERRETVAQLTEREAMGVERARVQ